MRVGWSCMHQELHLGDYPSRAFGGNKTLAATLAVCDGDAPPIPGYRVTRGRSNPGDLRGLHKLVRDLGGQSGSVVRLHACGRAMSGKPFLKQ